MDGRGNAEERSVKELAEALGAIEARAAAARRNLEDALDKGEASAQQMAEETAERRLVVDALVGIAKRDELEAFLELLAEQEHELEVAEHIVDLFDQGFAARFAHRSDSDEAAEDWVQQTANWVLKELEIASNAEDPVLSTAELATRLRPLIQSVF
jgi:hypothetical protein